MPGVGHKSALRFVLHLVKHKPGICDELINSIRDLKDNLKTCPKCGNFSDEALCHICSDPKRKREVICVVESVRDLMAIEETGHFYGTYHILGGVISPIEGIGPEDLKLIELVERVKEQEVDELIMAISPTIEGETTIYYISNLLKEMDVKISVIARGVSFGGELEYADELTLGRSIVSRMPYAKFLGSN